MFIVYIDSLKWKEVNHHPYLYPAQCLNKYLLIEQIGEWMNFIQKVKIDVIAFMLCATVILYKFFYF